MWFYSSFVAKMEFKMVKILKEGVELLLEKKRTQSELKSWFLYQEIKMHSMERLKAELDIDPESSEFAALVLKECVRVMPLSIPEGSVIAGTLDDAFSPSYALINPSFKVESFAGYCDPLAVYNDISPDDVFTKERIESVKAYLSETAYVKHLNDVYAEVANDTVEVAYFIEPVTGHIIPDMRRILAGGISGISANVAETNSAKAMISSLEAATILAERYAKLAAELMEERSDPAERVRLAKIADACAKVPAKPAWSLHDAIQSFALLWQVMCLEQAPNPYAISVGNLDRILQPYLKETSFAEAVQLIRHLLAFFMVGDRCWAISQNIMVGGRNSDGMDLTCDMTYIVLDAFFESNNPQPALSVKTHSATPKSLCESLGRFFFTPGHSTPSLFNDDEIFEVLRRKGIEEVDFADYGIAGCQEPLIMGLESANTTNSWLNLPKILELTINNGKSLLSDKKIGRSWSELGYDGVSSVLADLKRAFDKQLDYFLPRMEKAAKGCSANLATLPAPFTSVLLGCLESGCDYRDLENPGAKYNGSGCLVHGLSVLADSLYAISDFIDVKIASPETLLDALRNDYEGYEKIRGFMLARDKYGNNIAGVDQLTAKLAEEICAKLAGLCDNAGNSFAPDFSTPSTHLLYGYWVGATPDGRKAREMLGYGIDPRPGAANSGIQSRILSAKRMPFRMMTGGYASHFGLNPEDFAEFATKEEKGEVLWKRIIRPMFDNDAENGAAGYYLYFNIDNADHLRKVLRKPKVHAPNGIYIMRIHGTFVNFLDLSPAIQEDIIARLEPKSVA
jgi:formate C-acetyltransferase